MNAEPEPSSGCARDSSSARVRTRSERQPPRQTRRVGRRLSQFRENVQLVGSAVVDRAHLPASPPVDVVGYRGMPLLFAIGQEAGAATRSPRSRVAASPLGRVRASRELKVAGCGINYGAASYNPL